MVTDVMSKVVVEGLKAGEWHSRFPAYGQGLR
jgi:hypothetical protein